MEKESWLGMLKRILITSSRLIVQYKVMRDTFANDRAPKKGNGKINKTITIGRFYGILYWEKNSNGS